MDRESMKTKYKRLLKNLMQSEKYGAQIKRQVEQLGRQSNSLLIQVSKIFEKKQIDKTLIFEDSQELRNSKELLKRIEYRYEKEQLKLKEQQSRVKKIEEFFERNTQTNIYNKKRIQELKESIQRQKEVRQDYQSQLQLIEPRKLSSVAANKQNNSQNQSFTMKDSKQSIKQLSFDELKIQAIKLNNRLRKVTHEKEGECRKNTVLLQKIDLLTLKISEIEQETSLSRVDDRGVNAQSQRLKDLKSKDDSLNQNFKTLSKCFRGVAQYAEEISNFDSECSQYRTDAQKFVKNTNQGIRQLDYFAKRYAILSQ